MFAETTGMEKIPVLLVEDAVDEAKTTERRLHAVDEEFDICCVSSLQDALARIEHDKVDVILLDLGLPDSQGPRSIKILNERFPNLPIVVLSGRDDPSTIRTALECGAQGFLSKSESSGGVIRQALLSAIIRQSLANGLAS